MINFDIPLWGIILLGLSIIYNAIKLHLDVIALRRRIIAAETDIKINHNSATKANEDNKTLIEKVSKDTNNLIREEYRKLETFINKEVGIQKRESKESNKDLSDKVSKLNDVLVEVKVMTNLLVQDKIKKEE